MKNRCVLCNTTLGLMIFECTFCTCKFCVHHRLPEDHNCTNIEIVKNKYKEINKIKLEKEAFKENKLIKY